ncbi:MAG: hypothetical protein N3A66_08450, partial [Planctomycetota bacterium]|nr:hypothetical protein [Planctomycetota bacterium]
ITPWDLSDPRLGPKMRAMTRVFERIIAAAKREDASRVLQMSSAMDFLGRLAMYNLHYPKPWQSYPDYPHTAYWLEKPFLFPWYGAGRPYMPAWRWRRDKPLYLGEFICVHGATPDMQATIIGDIAFARPDFGTPLVCAKLWPMEIKAYRRHDVSGFCAWACLFPECRDVDQRLAEPHVKAHTQALRPLAVLCHTFREHYLAGDEMAMELSLHNDTRRELRLSLTCELRQGRNIVWQEKMPARAMLPAEVHACEYRLRLPATARQGDYNFRAILKAGAKTVDAWRKKIRVWPRKARLHLPTDMHFFDPDGLIAAPFAERGITGGYLCGPTLSAALRAALRKRKHIGLLWLHFPFGKISESEWQAARQRVLSLAQAGAVVVLDHPPAWALASLPVAVQPAIAQAKGCDTALAITYAYNHAPHHPLCRGLTDADLCLWGEDYYVARQTLEMPQEGNALPLLMAQANTLIASPFLEMPFGKGRLLLSTLEILEKLAEHPTPLALLGRLGAYRPAPWQKSIGVAASADSWRVYREVGLAVQDT